MTDIVTPKDVKTAELPAPVYGCAQEYCAAEVSYGPNMLRWWAGSPDHPAGFYCMESECLSEAVVGYYGPDHDMLDDPDGMVGPTLQEEIERRRRANAIRV